MVLNIPAAKLKREVEACIALGVKSNTPVYRKHKLLSLFDLTFDILYLRDTELRNGEPHRNNSFKL